MFLQGVKYRVTLVLLKINTNNSFYYGRGDTFSFNRKLCSIHAKAYPVFCNRVPKLMIDKKICHLWSAHREFVQVEARFTLCQ